MTFVLLLFHRETTIIDVLNSEQETDGKKRFLIMQSPEQLYQYDVMFFESSHDGLQILQKNIVKCVNNGAYVLVTEGKEDKYFTNHVEILGFMKQRHGLQVLARKCNFFLLL